MASQQHGQLARLVFKPAKAMIGASWLYPIKACIKLMPQISDKG